MPARTHELQPTPSPLSYRVPARFAMISLIGVWSLYLKEIRRFFSVIHQTITAPVITVALFLAVFSLALGRSVQSINGFEFAVFLVPGLVVMNMAQQAFANSSSSILIAKIQGNIVDLLMAPLRPIEIVIGLALGAVTRGLIVGCVTFLVMLIFVPISTASVGWMVYFAFFGSLMLGLMGLIVGIMAERFDQMAGVTNFIITPLSFLSGTFYSIDRLPQFAQELAHYNPFFYMIDGFRYGALGRSDVDPWAGVWVLFGTCVFLWFLAWWMVAYSRKLRP